MKPNSPPQSATPAPAPSLFPWRLWIAVAATCLLVAAAYWHGYRINLTPSEPMGLWRIVPLYRPAVAGDLVFICPPQSAEAQEAKARGYFRSGPCQGGLAPLIKRVVAVAGQHVEIDSIVTIDGIALASSDIHPFDGRGRRIRPDKGGTVPAGSVFVHSPYAGSYDSRYFGPLPVSGILGLAQELLTDAP